MAAGPEPPRSTLASHPGAERSGRYHEPVRRGCIPTFEDRVAQRAMTMVLKAVYEQDFLPCLYGFRPGRSAHQALRTLENVLCLKRPHWVFDIDIREYFGSIPRSDLRVFLDRRATDSVIRTMIDNSRRRRSSTPHDEGLPAGGVISPCLSNVLLHHLLDEWFENGVRPRLSGGLHPCPLR